MSEIKDHLSQEFIVELFKSCFVNEKVFEVVRVHLKYSYLVDEVEKKFWKEVNKQFALENKRPTFGNIQLALRKDEEALDYVVAVKTTDVENTDAILLSFQEFIKQSKFVELFETTGDAYNKGDQAKAYSMFIKGAEDLAGFSIKDKYYEKIFDGFEARNVERKMVDNRKKIPFFIDELDYYSHGGPEATDTVLFLGESGSGKSLALIHYGISTARVGGKVAHFQLEGTKRQCVDRYDSAWTGMLYHDMKNGAMADEDNKNRYKACKHIINKIGRGEVYVEAFEKFGSATIFDIRNSFREMKKNYGEFDLVLIDYLELLEVGDGVAYGEKGERFRQEKIGRFMKELAMEENVVVASATQASNVPYLLKIDPLFYITRDYLADAKGKIKPFDYFYTFNQTPDEKKLDIIRIFSDKLREHKSGQLSEIVTNLGRSRFYNRKATLDLQASREIERLQKEEDEATGVKEKSKKGK